MQGLGEFCNPEPFLHNLLEDVSFTRKINGNNLAKYNDEHLIYLVINLKLKQKLRKKWKNNVICCILCVICFNILYHHKWISFKQFLKILQSDSQNMTHVCNVHNWRIRTKFLRKAKNKGINCHHCYLSLMLVLLSPSQSEEGRPGLLPSCSLMSYLTNACRDIGGLTK